MYRSNDKMVNHPNHYKGKNGMEVIDVIQEFTSDLKGIEATDTGNIIKYALRWKQKNGIQDLEKMIWYAQHLIKHLKEKENKCMCKNQNDVKVSIDAISDENYFLLLNYETREEILRISKKNNSLDKVIEVFDCENLVEIIK